VDNCVAYGRSRSRRGGGSSSAKFFCLEQRAGLPRLWGSGRWSRRPRSPWAGTRSPRSAAGCGPQWRRASPDYWQTRRPTAESGPTSFPGLVWGCSGSGYFRDVVTGCVCESVNVGNARATYLDDFDKIRQELPGDKDNMKALPAGISCRLKELVIRSKGRERGGNESSEGNHPKRIEEKGSEGGTSRVMRTTLVFLCFSLFLMVFRASFGLKRRRIEGKSLEPWDFKIRASRLRGAAITHQEGSRCSHKCFETRRGLP